jgi:hypothetical protein
VATRAGRPEGPNPTPAAIRLIGPANFGRPRRVFDAAASPEIVTTLRGPGSASGGSRSPTIARALGWVSRVIARSYLTATRRSRTSILGRALQGIRGLAFACGRGADSTGLPRPGKRPWGIGCRPQRAGGLRPAWLPRGLRWWQRCDRRGARIEDHPMPKQKTIPTNRAERNMLRAGGRRGAIAGKPMEPTP